MFRLVGFDGFVGSYRSGGEYDVLVIYVEGRLAYELNVRCGGSCGNWSSLLGEGDYGRGYCDGIAIDGVLVVMSLVLVDWNDQLMLMINGG